ncbi:MAG: fluoride efflux transporter CrcB [Polyangiaceae bacterium]
MREVLYVALGGSLGAVSRYGIGEWARKRLGDALPWGTLIVNVVGSLLLGILLGLALREVGTRGQRLAFGTGFLGAFTTFSTFSTETVLMAQQGKLSGAVLNVVLNLAVGIGAAIGGLWLAAKVPVR